jgi:hypothetical protein
MRWEDDDPTLFRECTRSMCDGSEQGNLHLFGRNTSMVALLSTLCKRGIQALSKRIVKM